MTTILIADTNKSSIVMTSEVCKDRIPGCVVKVAESGLECMQMIQERAPDLIMIDFALPDTDGVMLTHLIRKNYDIPILMTAMPGQIVDEAISKELFFYDDVSSWIPKPPRVEVVKEKIEKFLINRGRVTKRFSTEVETMVIGKGSGRGKRAPKSKANVSNVSMSGALVELFEKTKFSAGEEVTIELPLERTPTTATKKAKLDKPTKLKCTVAWMNAKKAQAGLRFAGLSETQKRSLASFLKSSID